MTAVAPPSASLESSQSSKPPFYRDKVVIKWSLQIATLAILIFALWFLSKEAGDNLKASGISTSFDFLERDPGFLIGEGIDTDPATGGRALWVGMVSTFRLAGAGIFFATILGIIVGVSRLSSNWMANRAASMFIETVRNIPVLVQILIWSAVLGSTLPRLTRETGPIKDWLIMSSKGIALPRVFIADGFYQWLAVVLVGVGVAYFVRRNRLKVRDETGHDTKPNITALGIIAVFGVIGWFIHPVMGFLENVFQPISDAIAKIPEQVVQIALAALALAGAARWIKGFLDSRRTPAGLAKLDDDDYFRMIFAGVAGLLAALFFLVLWPGLSSWMINSTSDLFGVAADKFGNDGFGNDRSGGPFGAKKPDLIGNESLPNYGTAGLVLTPGFAAMFIGLTLYTASFIAEIVRGGILAVAKGQTEAASAIGLSRMQSLRYIILPQAFRVSLPPLGNQYLNITKNTTLAIAVGYSDVFSVGSTVQNQEGKPLPVFAIWMLFFLCCSLTISMIVNWWNRRLTIVER